MVCGFLLIPVGKELSHYQMGMLIEPSSVYLVVFVVSIASMRVCFFYIFVLVDIVVQKMLTKDAFRPC